MQYYNQRDYPDVPYPRPSDKNATVKSGGCGVCCGSTVLSYFGVDCPPEKLAPLFIAQGARADSGTDMRRAIEILCALGGLEYSTSSDETALAAHLRAGGVAIANVDGDAGEKGIFSSAGHYLVVLDVKPSGDLVIFDVGDYPSKYSSAYRAARVKREGKLLVCAQATLDVDTRHRSPNYYLIEEEDMTQEVFDKMLNDYLTRRGALGVNQNIAPAEFSEAVKAGITDGTRPQAFVTRQEAAIMAARAK